MKDERKVAEQQLMDSFLRWEQLEQILERTDNKESLMIVEEQTGQLRFA